LRKALIYLATFIISFFVITPLTIIDKLDYIRISEEDFSIFSLVIESYASPLLLFIMSCIFIPWVIRKISEYENPELKSRKESTIMNKNFIFIFLNCTIVPLINLTMIQTFIVNKNIDNEMLVERISHSTEFLLRLLIQITFISATIQLFASPYFATKKFKKWVNNEYKDENWQFQEWFFHIGYSVPYNAALFTMILVFSTIAPLVLPMGAILFYLKYMLDKYNLLYVCPEQFESAGKISRSKPIYYVIFSLVLYHTAMIIVFVVVNNYIMYSLLGLVAIVGFLFSLWIIKKKNVKLNMVESKKQKTVSFILNPQKNDTEAMIRSRVFFDEENHEDIIERLKNSYIHPCEKTFHAPIFKRRSRRSSVRFLFDFDTAAESKAPKSEGDREDHQTNFSSQDSLEESKS